MSQKILFLMVLVWLTSLLMVIRSAADTFDGNRKGFIFGAGVGLGVTRYASSNEFASGHGYPAAIAYNFQVGYAPTDKLQLYYTMRQCVFIPEIVDNYKDFFDEIGKGSSKGELYLLISPFVIALIPLFSEQHLMPMGFGIRQYFNSQAPSLFVDIGAGVTASSFPYKNKNYPGFKPPRNMDTAPGIFGGAGYEWDRHLHIEASFMWAHSSRTEYYYPEYRLSPPTHDKYDLLSLALSVSICEY